MLALAAQGGAPRLQASFAHVASEALGAFGFQAMHTRPAHPGLDSVNQRVPSVGGCVKRETKRRRRVGF